MVNDSIDVNVERRRLALIKACIKIPTEALEAGVVGMMSEYILGWAAPDTSKEDHQIEVNRRRQEIKGWLQLGTTGQQEERM